MDSDSLAYVEGTDQNEHLNKFNSYIAQLARPKDSMEDKQNKSVAITHYLNLYQLSLRILFLCGGSILRLKIEIRLIVFEKTI